MITPPLRWQRWLLLAILCAIGLAYVAAFWFFVTNSKDFVANGLNVPARQYATANRLSAQTTLRFGENSPDLNHLGSGWHPAEAEGSWSNWPDAWVYLAIESPRDTVTIRIKAEGFSVPGLPAKDVTLKVNGIRVANWVLDAASPRLSASVTVPREPADDSLMELHFHVDSPTSPRHRRVGDDWRSLGLRLDSLEIDF